MRHRPPLYSRLLRLHHLRLQPLMVFVLFEGSVCVGVLLVMADAVTPWGILAVSGAVAVMVKFNDVIAGALRPGSRVRQFDRDGMHGVAIGRSAILSPSRPTTWIDTDDAVYDPAASPDGVPDPEGGEGAAGPTRKPHPGVWPSGPFSKEDRSRADGVAPPRSGHEPGDGMESRGYFRSWAS